MQQLQSSPSPVPSTPSSSSSSLALVPRPFVNFVANGGGVGNMGVPLKAEELFTPKNNNYNSNDNTISNNYNRIDRYNNYYNRNSNNSAVSNNYNSNNVNNSNYNNSNKFNLNNNISSIDINSNNINGSMNNNAIDPSSQNGATTTDAVITQIVFNGRGSMGVTFTHHILSYQVGAYMQLVNVAVVQANNGGSSIRPGNDAILTDYQKNMYSTAFRPLRTDFLLLSTCRLFAFIFFNNHSHIDSNPNSIPTLPCLTLSNLT